MRKCPLWGLFDFYKSAIFFNIGCVFKTKSDVTVTITINSHEYIFINAIIRRFYIVEAKPVFSRQLLIAFTKRVNGKIIRPTRSVLRNVIFF